MTLLTNMLTIRMVEERISEVYHEQEMKCPVHLCTGQEAIAAGICAHLKKSDYIFSTHRSHGHCIAKGMDLKSLVAELYGKVTGCCRGKGGSMHLADPECGIPGTTAIVGGAIPLAVGAALSARMQGEGRVSVAFFGDGGVDEGVFHESLNFASLRKLPVIFVCENNFYATNSPQSARQPDVSIADRACAYDMPGSSADGNDVLSVYEAGGEAIERARSGKGPTLLEFRTYRWKAHVGPVNDVALRCRPSSEYEEWMRRCPVEAYRKYIFDNHILTEKELDAIMAEIEIRIDDAFSFARNSPFPDLSELLDDVY